MTEASIEIPGTASVIDVDQPEVVDAVPNGQLVVVGPVSGHQAAPPVPVAACCSAIHASTSAFRQTRRLPSLKLAGPVPSIAQYLQVLAFVPVSFSRSSESISSLSTSISFVIGMKSRIRMPIQEVLTTRVALCNLIWSIVPIWEYES